MRVLVRANPGLAEVGALPGKSPSPMQIVVVLEFLLGRRFFVRRVLVQRINLTTTVGMILASFQIVLVPVRASRGILLQHIYFLADLRRHRL